MPELPEVRTVSKYLRENLLGKKILDFDLKTKKSLHDNEIENLDLLKNQKIYDIKTLGKYIIFELTNFYLVIHLRMEGKINFYKEQPTHFNLIHSIFLMQLDDLFFNFTDHRKFATVDIYFKKDKNIRNLNVLKKIGFEPWDIDIDSFFEKVKKKSSPIKVVLLDQHNIAGLGNIYVDEVLYRAKIHPLQKTNTISKDKLREVLKHSKKILEEAIELGGSTIKTYSAAGNEGLFQNKLIVHQYKNKYCKNCGEKIKIIKVGGRGTYFCPNEQKLWE
ncbi:MAG: formamidopyrimidine-DNA glycosylase [Candidatus Hepatoplasma vulgare]|nr:MAG: formamidopyrimidine-DNA glycosylase [Candidatus Hepatoplasma sp.]